MAMNEREKELVMKLMRAALHLEKHQQAEEDSFPIAVNVLLDEEEIALLSEGLVTLSVMRGVGDKFRQEVGGCEDYGWFGEFAAAFKEADRFEKFSDHDIRELARVAAAKVKDVQRTDRAIPRNPDPPDPILYPPIRRRESTE